MTTITFITADADGWITSAWVDDPGLADALQVDGFEWAGTAALRPRLVDGEVVWQDPRSLAEIKAAKNAEINEARLAANRGGFLFQGKLIASDELSRSDIDAVQAIVARTDALPAGWPGGWKAMDNSMLPIPDVATWDAFYAAMYQTGLANFAKAQTLKAQLAEAATAEQVNSIEW